MCFEEYSSIRSEIISLNEIKHTYIITMISGSIAIMGVELEMKNPYMSFLVYVVLFSLQSTITRLNRNMQRLSAFLACYGNDIWEKNYEEICKSYNKAENNKSKKFSRIQSMHLAIINSAVCIILVINNLFKGDLILIASKEDWAMFFTMIISIVMTVVFCNWYKKEISSNNLRNEYINCLNGSKF